MTERNTKGAPELSLKRLLYLVLAVAALGGVFLLVNNQGSEAATSLKGGEGASDRTYLEAGSVKEGEGPRVWVLGSPNEGRYGQIFENVRLFCDDIHLVVAGAGTLDAQAVQKGDLVIACHPDLSRFVDAADLEGLIARGGRVVAAAGLAEGNRDAALWPAFGIRGKSGQRECREVVFQEALFPVQPQRAVYGGESRCADVEVTDDAVVYLSSEKDEVPIVYAHPWGEGAVCVINGTFLEDARYLGLLSGAIGTLLPDFVYPVLGVKALFLDNFPPATETGEQAQQRYGYSAEGFAQEVVWPAFQGVSLRTETPCTTSMLAVASSPDDFGTQDEALLKAAGEAVLQVGGELSFGARCSGDGKVAFNHDLVNEVAAAFPLYTVRSLALEADDFSPEMLEVPGADIQVVRGTLAGREEQCAESEGLAVFPAATEGNTIEDGNLLAACSVLGAYGLVSHVFDMEGLVAGADDESSWDSAKEQIGLFESEVLSKAPWLEGRTLSDTKDDAKSYEELDFSWVVEGDRMELDCRSAVQGQAFYYHTDRRIADAEGASFKDVGGGYYLLRMQAAHAEITLEEGR